MFLVTLVMFLLTYSAQIINVTTSLQDVKGKTCNLINAKQIFKIFVLNILFLLCIFQSF